MNNYKAILETALQLFSNATLSKPQNVQSNVKIKPVVINGKKLYQATWIENAKAFHKNYSFTELVEYLNGVFPAQFRQCFIATPEHHFQFLADKHRNVHVVKHKNELAKTKKQINLMPVHNRKKQYIIQEGKMIPWLKDLGVINESGCVVRKYHDKFRQINKFLEFIDDIWPALSHHAPLKIVDFGCGKSYLTFAMHYYFSELKKAPVEMTGLDLKQDVMEYCNTLAKRYQLEHLVFKTGDIAGFTEISHADMVVCLHACDTATDYALAKAVSWSADAILAVPCCHKELIHTISSEPLEAMLQHGIVRERIGSLVTDTVRALAMEAVGYKTTIMEFIATEHTPKNILIRAQKLKIFSEEQKARAYEKLASYLAFWKIYPLIVRLLDVPLP